MARTTELTDIADELRSKVDDGRLKLGDLMEAWGSRAYGPLLLVIAVLSASPIGAVPGMSIIFGSMIVLIAGQLAAGLKHPWLPSSLLEKEFSADTSQRSMDILQKLMERSKTWVTRRATVFVSPPMDRVIAVICIVLALTFYPLALVPFGVFVPSLAIGFLSMALVARDGFLSVFGLLLAVSAIALFISTYAAWV